jgi:hypothetical protein
MDIAVVSVISGATVAIAVPFISARLERHRLSLTANQARLDELRDVLDRGAIALTDAQMEMDNSMSWVQHAVKQWEKVGKPLTMNLEPFFARRLRYQDAMEQVWRAANSMAVRLGHEHSLYTFYLSAAESGRVVLRVFADYNDPKSFTRERNDALNAAQKALQDAEARFQSEAAATVGPRFG